MPSPFRKKEREPAHDFVNETHNAFEAGAQSEQSAGQKALALKQSVKDALDKQAAKAIQGITDWDWHKVPPPVMVEIIKRTPMRGDAGEPDYYLEEYQAYRFAIRCYELGLSPLSTEVWYNRKNNMTNITFEGKLRLAQLKGLNLGPPKLERIPADETRPLVAYRCIIKTPFGDCEYTATLKEWMQPKSPVWRDRPAHMLQLRAAEKCLSFASGIGSSELMGEQDLGKDPEKQELPTIDATNFEYKEMENKP